MSTLPLPDQYTRGLERRYVEKCDRVEALEVKLADKEICIVALEKLVLQLDKVYDEALKRIKVLESAIKGPTL